MENLVECSRGWGQSQLPHVLLRTSTPHQLPIHQWIVFISWCFLMFFDVLWCLLMSYVDYAMPIVLLPSSMIVVMINIYKHHLFIQFEKWHVDWFGAHASTSRSSNSYSCCWSVWLGGISCFTSSSEFAHEGRNGLRVCTWSSRLCVWLQVGRVIIVYDK